MELIRTDHQIKIAIGPQPSFGVVSRRSPTLDQNGLNILGAKEPEDLLDFFFMNCRLQALQAEGLLEHDCRRRSTQLSLAQAPPAKCSGARSIKERYYFIELRFC